MNRWKVTMAAVVVCTAFGGCQKAQVVDDSLTAPVPHVVTADIQAGIEKHIEEQSRLSGGYFNLPFEDRQMRLKLVRVHTEYLANLGPRRHFACVDLASTEGNVYDVDFFISGDPGNMTVTETTVHKINGQPLYVWKQSADKTWRRATVTNASERELGIITGTDKFDFLYRAKLPELTGNAQMWIPLPATDNFQTVEVKSIMAPGEQEILRDQKYGNEVLYLNLEPADSGKTIAIRFQTQRREKAAYSENDTTPEDFLAPDRLVPENEEFQTIADGVVAGKKGDLVRARALYDHVIDRMSYMKFGSGYGKGNAVYACDARTGNCTDFHAYFIALARAAGIPARFAIGASIPSSRDEGGISGYHCWAEFYGEGKWWPIDISEGDKYSPLSTYYFGHHPANRIELSRGRDLIVEPGPQSGPINFLAYPVLEVAGKPEKVEVDFSFSRL